MTTATSAASQLPGGPPQLEGDPTEPMEARLFNAPRCQARTKAGPPCRSPAVKGKRVCRSHGGARGSGGPYGERMLMAYFPDAKLLYGADLVFPNRAVTGQPGKGYFETSLVDLRNAVEREKLAVDTLFCVQNYQPIAWSDFVAR